MSITAIALKRARFTLVAALGLVMAGLWMLPGFPSTEEPTVPVRVATVEAYLPGASSERVEQLVARPLEERLREVPNVQHVDATIRPGGTFLYVQLRDATPEADMPATWQRLRAKVADVAGTLPEGTIGPLVNDEFGRVAVRSIALTAPGYTDGQRQDAARALRDALLQVEGVERVSLHGVREEEVLVELSPARLAEHGLDAGAVAAALGGRNRIAPSGELVLDGRALALDPLDEVPDAHALAGVLVPLPGGGALPLGALGRVVQQPVDPIATAALFDGEAAVVLGVSMQPGQDVQGFAARVDAAMHDAAGALPAGMQVGRVTDQATIVRGELTRVGKVFLETVVIVMAVVVGFLGWRAGLVTGLIVPLTVLGSLLVMRVLGIELHQISIAAIIISLGLFVDNAIVIVEDIQRRLGLGESHADAAVAAGRTMASPLLISSLAIILAFVPLVAGDTDTAEYMRSLAIVLAITLLLSLFLALSVVPVLATRLARAEAHGHEDRGLIGRAARWYGGHVRTLLHRPLPVLGAMLALLVGAGALLASLPSELLSPSARRQLQVPIELAPGTSSARTFAVAQALSTRLASEDWADAIDSHAIYVGDGGPRFILGLNPPTPAAHVAYAVLNIGGDADLDATADALREDLQRIAPEARIEPKRFSLGVSEAGVAVFRLLGPDRDALLQDAAALRAALAEVPGMRDIRDDAEARIEALAIDIDHDRAALAGLDTATIAAAVQAGFAGVEATRLRFGDVRVPVVLRAPTAERTDPERLSALLLPGRDGPVALGTVARIRTDSQPSVLMRRDGRAAVTVEAWHPDMTAQQIVDALQPALDALPARSGHVLQLGGEIEEAAEANLGLATYLPAALLGMAGLFLWQFGSVRKAAIVMASIPFVLIGASLGLLLTGHALSYTATLGLLALAGIIVNNAVLLLERIHEEEAAGLGVVDAVASAAQVRLRPIVMTKLTCIVGLLPLYLFGGALWQPLAATMIGGLALGTLITLVLIPALYALAYRGRAAAPSPTATAES